MTRKQLKKQLKKARKLQGHKVAGGDTFTATLRPLAHCIRKATLPAGLLLTAGTAFAGPQGGQVVGGQGNITRPDANTTVINQASSRLSVDWTSFNVAQHELVQFNQPSKAASALNRIYDQNPSQIFGSLRANGNVLLVNPNGIFFGPTASVNVNSLIASGLDMKTEDFMAGKYNFEMPIDEAGGLVVNQGILQAATGGSINLVGGAVKNEGVILATAGQVNLVAGNQITMDFDGDGLIQFAVDKEILENVHDLDDAISNTGEIAAEGGAVLLKGSAAKDVFSNVVNNSGVIRAGRIENKGGQIKLIAGGPSNSIINTGTLDATGYGGDGGTIEIYATEDITVTGDSIITANASSAEGSTISLINGELTIANYDPDASYQISEGDYVAITKATADTHENISVGSIDGGNNINISGTSDNTVVITGSDYSAESAEGNVSITLGSVSADSISIGVAVGTIAASTNATTIDASTSYDTSADLTLTANNDGIVLGSSLVAGEISAGNVSGVVSSIEVADTPVITITDSNIDLSASTPTIHATAEITLNASADSSGSTSTTDGNITLSSAVETSGVGNQATSATVESISLAEATVTTTAVSTSEVQSQASNENASTTVSSMDEEYGNGGTITFTAGNKTVISGNSQVTATSAEGVGGKVHILADKVGVFDNALVDVSGDQGGGEVLVGGDFQGRTAEILNATQTIISPDAVIRADAIRQGHGGKVIVWSDVSTIFHGNISAQGGAQSGNGGFVEVSGKEYLDFIGSVDTTAANGEIGTLLLDPKNIIIDDMGANTVGPNHLQGSVNDDANNSRYAFTEGEGGTGSDFNSVIDAAVP